jgi:competence protein ComEA
MKALLISLALLTSAAFAQVPNTDALKGKADTATTNAAATANKAQTDATTATTGAKGKMGALKEKALVNLNTASKADLAKLPGIGPVRADAIIKGRPYAEVTDLKKVKGIGDGVIAKIKDYVTVK